MPPRPRGHGSDGEEPSRPPRTRPTAHSVRAAEADVVDLLRSGRKSGSSADIIVTHPSGRAGGTPDGHPRRIERDDDVATRRSIEMENSGAVTLARQGWQIKQNPTHAEVAQARIDTGDTGNPDSNPDYLLEGRVFDALSPTKPTKSVRNLWSDVEDKVVVKQQTQRVVVNLADWRGDLAALRKQFADWPIEGLKEVKVITRDGEIVQIDLPRGTTESGTGHGA